MKTAMFEELLESTREALAHARGKLDLRSTALPPAPQPMRADDVRQLRDRMHASQAVFARYLNVSTKLVQAWEADRRRPEGAALALLRICERDPAIVIVRSHPVEQKHSVRAGKRRKQVA